MLYHIAPLGRKSPDSDANLNVPSIINTVLPGIMGRVGDTLQQFVQLVTSSIDDQQLARVCDPTEHPVAGPPRSVLVNWCSGKLSSHWTTAHITTTRSWYELHFRRDWSIRSMARKNTNHDRADRATRFDATSATAPTTITHTRKLWYGFLARNCIHA